MLLNCYAVGFLVLLGVLNARLIKPYFNSYISLATSNPQLLTAYNFTLLLPSGLPSDGSITIQFPDEEYNAGLATSPAAFKVLLTDADITSNVSLIDRTFTIRPGYALAANSQIQLSIDSLYNPSKSGGTGNFRIATYDNQSNLIDEGDSFGTIGFTALAAQLQDLQAASSSYSAGDSINYTIGFTSLQTIQSRPQLTIRFPSEYNLNSVTSCLCQDTSSAIAYQPRTNTLYVSGFGSLMKGAYLNCTVMGVINPSYELITGLVGVSLGVQGSAAVTQSGNTYPVYIAANSIGLSAASNQSLFGNLNRTVVLTLQPTNPFAALKLVTPFRPIYNVTVQCGLEYTTLNATLLYNLVQLTNFTASGGSVVNISLTGIITEQIGYVQTSIIEAYSYLDSSFQFLVDYSNSSNLTTLTPVANVSVLATATATTTDLKTLQPNVIVLTIKTPLVTVIDEIDLEAAEFSNLTLCKVNGVVQDCELLNDTILLTDLNAPVGPVAGVTVELHLYNPRLSGTFPIGVVAKTASTTYYQSLSFVFVPSSIPAVTLVPIYGIGIKVALNLSGLVVIQGNSNYRTDYQRHSYINITSPTSINGYACSFGKLFIASPTSAFQGAWCNFTGKSILIGGYQLLSNLSDVEFIILANNQTNQQYTVELREAMQSLSSVIATQLVTVASAPLPPPVASLAAVSNLTYMATQTYNFTFNASDYLLIETPLATACCSQVFLDSYNLSSLSYVNTSKGVIVNTTVLGAGVHNLSIVNLNLTSGFTSGGLLKVTEFMGQLATAQHQQSIQVATFIQPSWRLIVSDSTAGFPYANYTFTFNTTYSPLSQTDLVLSFNPASYPFVILPILQQLLINQKYQTTLPTLGLAGPGKLRISNIAYGRAQGMIWFTLFGIANPAAGTQTVSVSYLDNTGFQQATASVAYNITSAAASNSNTFNLQVIPNSTSLYKIMVMSVPFQFLPRETVILLQPTNASFNSSSWLTSSSYVAYSVASPTLMNCTVKQHITTIDQSNIQLHIYNFTIVTSQIALNLTFQYRSTVFYQQTVSATIAQATPPSCQAALQFYPQNSAETATYDITLKQAQLQQGQMLYVQFGPEFISGLSPRLLDISSAQLEGPISYIIYEEMLVVYGFFTQATALDTLVSIFGIVNPNRKGLNLTTTFNVYILNNDSSINQSCSMPGIQLTVPPVVLQLNSIATSNSISRYIATYHFTFLVASMPKAADGGIFFFDFPEEYWVDAIGSCSINSSFSLDSYCTLRGYRIIFHTNHENNITSDTILTATISGIRNPEFTGNTSNFVVGVYDSVNRVVLSRTYGNVNPTYITSAQKAQEILINNLSPLYIERGTLSDAYTIQFQSPAKVPVTLIPNVLSKQVVVVPNFIQVHIGDTNLSFRMASSKYTSETRLQLNWTKTNDNVQEVYMTLYRSPIYILPTVTIKYLTVEFPLMLYQNGSSFRYSVCVDNPPYNTLQVSININNSCTSRDIINPITLVSSCTSYVLMCPIGAAQGTALITFSNNQQDLYQFVNKTVQPTLIGYSPAIPYVNSVAVVTQTRTTATIQIDSPSTMKVYYVVADCGYLPVSFLDVFNTNSLSAALNWSNPAFSVLEVEVGVVNYTVQGLRAGHCYQFTLYLVSMFSVQNNTAIIRRVTTSNPETSVVFTLRLRQSELLPSFQAQYLQSISTILAVPSGRVISDGCNRTVWDGLLLSWNAILLSDATNQNPNTEPMQLIQYLNRSIDTLSSYIPKLVVEHIVYTSYTPSLWNPSAVNVQVVSQALATIQVAGTSCYTLSLVVNPIDTTSPPVLNSFYQTANLLTYVNQPASFQLQKVLSNTTEVVQLPDLTSQQNYRFEYVIWRPYLQQSISAVPTVVQFATGSPKEQIDLTSIYVSSYSQAIHFGLILILASCLFD